MIGHSEAKPYEGDSLERMARTHVSATVARQLLRGRALPAPRVCVVLAREPGQGMIRKTVSLCNIRDAARAVLHDTYELNTDDRELVGRKAARKA